MRTPNLFFFIEELKTILVLEEKLAEEIKVYRSEAAGLLTIAASKQHVIIQQVKKLLNAYEPKTHL